MFWCEWWESLRGLPVKVSYSAITPGRAASQTALFIRFAFRKGSSNVCLFLLPKNGKHFREPVKDQSRSRDKSPAKRDFAWSRNEKTSVYATLFEFIQKQTFSVFAAGAGGGSRTHTSFRTQDFKSCASAIPPHQLNVQKR